MIRYKSIIELELKCRRRLREVLHNVKVLLQLCKQELCLYQVSGTNASLRVHSNCFLVDKYQQYLSGTPFVLSVVHLLRSIELYQRNCITISKNSVTVKKMYILPKERIITTRILVCFCLKQHSDQTKPLISSFDHKYVFHALGISRGEFFERNQQSVYRVTSQLWPRMRQSCKCGFD